MGGYHLEHGQVGPINWHAGGPNNKDRRRRIDGVGVWDQLFLDHGF